MFKKKRGQSILEYVIVLTAIIVCIIYAANTFIKPAIEQGLNNSKTAVERAAGKLPSD